MLKYEISSAWKRKSNSAPIDRPLKHALSRDSWPLHVLPDRPIVI